MALEVELQSLIPPGETALAAELLAFLGHKGSPWIDDIRHRVERRWGELGDHFLVARHHDRLVAHAWYCASPANPEIGLLGHIYTDPNYRKQGIARQLVARAMSDFRARGGKVMQLFTSAPYALDFYRQFGFQTRYDARVYHDRDWYMSTGAPFHEQTLAHEQTLCHEPTLSAAWKATDPSVTAIQAGDLPAFCLLYNAEHATRLKNWSQRIGTGLEAELAFIETWNRVQAGQDVCCALRRGPVLTGIAVVSRSSFPHQAHLGRFDFYSYGSLVDDVSALVRHTLSQAAALGLERLCSVTVDPAKQETLEGHGFRPVGPVADCYRLEGQSLEGIFSVSSIGD